MTKKEQILNINTLYSVDTYSYFNYDIEDYLDEGEDLGSCDVTYNKRGIVEELAQKSIEYIESIVNYKIIQK